MHRQLSWVRRVVIVLTAVAAVVVVIGALPPAAAGTFSKLLLNSGNADITMHDQRQGHLVSTMRGTWKEKTSRRGLVSGGSDASPGEFPWFVSMEGLMNNRFISCGGTLIAPDRVLVAAHCCLNYAPSVRIGPTTRENGEVMDVDCVSIHPEYGYDGVGYNDLAILKLSKPSTTTKSFVTLNNDTNYPFTVDQELVTMGFGVTNPLSQFSWWNFWRLRKPYALQKVTTNYVDHEPCQELLHPCIDSSYHVCTFVEGGATTFGDSGGPLLDSNNVQIGVVTGGVNTSEPDYFVNIAYYYDWIQSEITSTTCPNSDDATSTFESPCNRSSWSSSPGLGATAGGTKTGDGKVRETTSTIWGWLFGNF